MRKQHKADLPVIPGTASRAALRALAAAALLIALGIAGCSGAPNAPDARTRQAEAADRLVSEAAQYALWVSQQPDEVLRDQIASLETKWDSPEEMLRLALILGKRDSALHDPDRTARILARLAEEASQASVHAQLAQVLLGLLPREERSCGEAVCEEKLNLVVEMEERRRRELAARIDALRHELESERAQRAKLESQLEALKSIEEQIQNRDGPQ